MSGFETAKLDRESFMQLFRYAVIGVATNIAGYLLYLLLTSMGSTPKITMTVLYSVGAVVGFVGNKEFTFSYKGSLLGSSIRYALTHLFGYLLNFFILFVFVDHVGHPHQVVQGIAILAVAAFLFVCFKLFVFREAGNAETTESVPVTSELAIGTTNRTAWRQRDQ